MNTVQLFKGNQLRYTTTVAGVPAMLDMGEVDESLKGVRVITTMKILVDTREQLKSVASLFQMYCEIHINVHAVDLETAHADNGLEWQNFMNDCVLLCVAQELLFGTKLPLIKFTRVHQNE